MSGKYGSNDFPGSYVDNLDNVLIREGSTVALSAAMPGLAGATSKERRPIRRHAKPDILIDRYGM